MARDLNQPDPIDRLRWLTCKNGSAEQIPAFALLRVTSVDSDGVLTVDKPNADGQQALLINGPVPVPVAGLGDCTFDTPWYAAYNAGDGTPANGDTWGAASGDWLLRLSKTGFVTLGGVLVSGGNGRVIVLRSRAGYDGSLEVCTPGGSGTATITIQDGQIAGVA